MASERITRSDAQRVVVDAKGEKHEFACGSGEHILYAGLRAGLALPYECASGTCGTCKAALTEGQTAYAWEEAPGRKYTRAERGEILMCQSLALSAVTLALPRPLETGKAPRYAPDYLHGTIVRAQGLVDDIIELDVALERPMHFEAGQFVLFEIDAVVGARSYSMVNFGPAARELRFLIKRLPGGALTEWLFAHPLEGTRVRLFGPLGRASFQPEEIRHVVCIAGGSGIAGMMSILAHAAQEAHFDRHDARVYFGVRTPKDAFYLDELASHVRRFGERMRVVIGFSHEEPSSDFRLRHAELEFDQGFIHEVAKRALGASPADTMVYVAGPPPMVDATLRMLLLELKHSGANIRYDKFS